jgi:hypothetical protein
MEKKRFLTLQSLQQLDISKLSNFVVDYQPSLISIVNWTWIRIGLGGAVLKKLLLSAAEAKPCSLRGVKRVQRHQL